ncbi:HD-GYP domain, c-di-GMP phosphodiesterase class II (or its inactivated variant) [Rhodoferax sp. OV413]|uniref:HD family phosphohydrolase n=1 Tax=Rhodoferax sp. OV413 TaxID=1855285 RepID=UPI00087EF7BD|nr:HD family phosphohydrolase [Rhodoferax sp. OV413]SDO04100.1 HD-GYP domain, c-di-GMP phosphodiesterase class II (or its inactivated variant) [Rhodoferax sp. OV413]
MTMDLVGDLLGRLDQLNAIGAALSKERDINGLLEGILIAAKNITQADGGTLYRMTEDGSALRFEIMRTNSLDIFLGGTTGRSIAFAPLQLINAEGGFNDTMVATYVAIHDRTVNVADAYTEPEFDFSGTRKFDTQTGYRSQSFLAVPLKNFEGEVIGVLQLINAMEPDTGRVVTFSEADQRLVESLASQAAIALSNRLLVNQLETLFEAFIKLINTAIDEKSPYARGRFLRVPALTMMLAEAVDAVTEGPYASFSMTERDRYELKIAGMLHDCGKIATPVHVVDKATKLQTLYDRIGLIDTRFEVLKRDAEIAMLRQQLALRTCTDPAAEAALAEQKQAAVTRIEADRAFLREVNPGQTAMTDAQLQRVREIGTQRRWTNPEGASSPFLSGDELENLSIRRGTLNPQEREIVNHHIVATNQMLEQVPWPKHLKNVPEYAGAHHERMDGTGYPKGLTRHQMSLQARMLALSDVFEALTSAKRPYRPRMKLSKALEMMVRFSKNGHIDPDLFDVFMRQGVYRRYAEQFMNPEQLDLPADTLPYVAPSPVF